MIILGAFIIWGLGWWLNVRLANGPGEAGVVTELRNIGNQDAVIRDGATQGIGQLGQVSERGEFLVHAGSVPHTNAKEGFSFRGRAIKF